MNTAIVLAGGSGKRMHSEIPKQYMQLNGKPVIYYSLKAFEESEHVDEIILVTAKEYIEYVRNEIAGSQFAKLTKIIDGGKERFDSVWAGLQQISEKGYVYIHDGARPCINQNIINACWETVVKTDACVAAAPVKDTIKVADADEYAINTPDRKTLWQIQTPQVFSADVIKEAYSRLYEQNCFDGVTDDAMVVERYGNSKIKLVNCGYCNIKITTPEDMEIAGIFLKG